MVDAITKAVKADHKAISAAVFPGPSMARKMVKSVIIFLYLSQERFFTILHGSFVIT